MVCNCCGQSITTRNLDGAHVYRFGVFCEVSPRVVDRVGWQYRAVCRPCAARIDRAYELRKFTAAHAVRRVS